eukprot:UN16630
MRIHSSLHNDSVIVSFCIKLLARDSGFLDATLRQNLHHFSEVTEPTLTPLIFTSS